MCFALLFSLWFFFRFFFFREGLANQSLFACVCVCVPKIPKIFYFHPNPF
jgi:hypothetical protein